MLELLCGQALVLRVVELVHRLAEPVTRPSDLDVHALRLVPTEQDGELRFGAADLTRKHRELSRQVRTRRRRRGLLRLARLRAALLRRARLLAARVLELKVEPSNDIQLPPDTRRPVRLRLALRVRP